MKEVAFLAYAMGSESERSVSKEKALMLRCSTTETSSHSLSV